MEIKKIVDLFQYLLHWNNEQPVSMMDFRDLSYTSSFSFFVSVYRKIILHLENIFVTHINIVIHLSQN